MPADLPDLMLGIETVLATIQGLRTSDVIPSEISSPEAIVGVPPIPDYIKGLVHGRPELEPTILVLTSATVDRVGQRKLAAFASTIGPQSIPAAFAADRRLGGKVSDCLVKSFQPLPLQEVGIIPFYGGLFTLQVMI